VIAATVAHVLDTHFPDARCDLNAKDAWELLIAAILSVRATDPQVNKALAVLLEHFASPEALAAADPRHVAPFIRGLPLFQQKARALTEMARRIVRDHGGAVPRDGDALRALPGVGRKVAAVVLGNAFGTPAIAADTHVCRIAHRLGWIASEDPLAAEQALAERFPAAEWVRRCHQLIRLGRTWCKRTQPRCGACALNATCPRRGVAA